MSQPELDKARDLIKQKRYQEARDLLQTIDHPEAVELVLAIESIELIDRIDQQWQDYDTKFLEEWVKAEQRLYEYLAYGSLIAAIYFIVADPFQTRVASPSPFSNAWLSVIPASLILFAIFLWWFKGREETIRKNFIRLQAGQYKFSAFLMYGAALIGGVIGLVSRNGVTLFGAAISVIVGSIMWWRMKQAEKLFLASKK